MNIPPHLTNDPIAYVAVPRSLLAQVYAFLGELLLEEAEPESRVDSAKREYTQEEYTQEEMRRIKEEIRYPTVLAILDVTAQRPGEWISYSEILAAAGIENYRAGNAQLGAFTKYMRKYLGREHWPFEYAVPEGETRGHYRMDKLNASRWRNA